jgi:hypothetical protein
MSLTTPEMIEKLKPGQIAQVVGVEDYVYVKPSFQGMDNVLFWDLEDEDGGVFIINEHVMKHKWTIEDVKIYKMWEILRDSKPGDVFKIVKDGGPWKGAVIRRSPNNIEWIEKPEKLYQAYLYLCPA